MPSRWRFVRQAGQSADVLSALIAGGRFTAHFQPSNFLPELCPPSRKLDCHRPGSGRVAASDAHLNEGTVRTAPRSSQCPILGGVAAWREPGRQLHVEFWRLIRGKRTHVPGVGHGGTRQEIAQIRILGLNKSRVKRRSPCPKPLRPLASLIRGPLIRTLNLRGDDQATI